MGLKSLEVKTQEPLALAERTDRERERGKREGKERKRIRKKKKKETLKERNAIKIKREKVENKKIRSNLILNRCNSTVGLLSGTRRNISAAVSGAAE